MIFFPLQHSFSVMISRLYTQLQQLFCINCQKIQNWESLFRKIVYCTESCLFWVIFWFLHMQYINTHWSIYKINCWVSYKYQPSRGPGLRSRNKDRMVGPDYSIAVHFWHHKPHFPDQPMRVEFYFRPRDTQFSWFPYRVRTWPSDRKWTQSHQRWETQRGNLCSARMTSHIV